ncbi:MAG: hypothetical protein ACI8XB_003186 [Patiriisocius sp.]|jgi:hypothetical protein
MMINNYLKISTILLPLFFIGWINPIVINHIGSQDESIEINIGNKKGFLFNSTITEKYFSAKKEFEYLNYWKATECTISELESDIDDYLSLKIKPEISKNNEKYIRQYFPFINEKGEMIVVITFSLLSDLEYNRVIERIKKNFRGVYDSNKNYFVLVHNYSDGSFISEPALQLAPPLETKK